MGKVVHQLEFFPLRFTFAEQTRLIDTPEFPKLGYIGLQPELVVMSLRSVDRVVVRYDYPIVYKDGTCKAEEIALLVRMCPQDVQRLETLTTKNVGKDILIILDNRPLISVLVSNPVRDGSWELNPGSDAKLRRVENALIEMVQTTER